MAKTPVESFGHLRSTHVDQQRSPLPLRAELETLPGSDLLLKMPVDNFEHFVSRPPETRINEHKFDPLCSPRHAHERQMPVFWCRRARKIGHFGWPVWDPFPRCEIQPLTRQRLTATVPKTADAKPSRSRGLQHFAHHARNQTCETPAPTPQSPTPTPLLQCRLVQDFSIGVRRCPGNRVVPF
jgi:hypothetical protein